MGSLPALQRFNNPCSSSFCNREPSVVQCPRLQQRKAPSLSQSIRQQRHGQRLVKAEQACGCLHGWGKKKRKLCGRVASLVSSLEQASEPDEEVQSEEDIEDEATTSHTTSDTEEESQRPHHRSFKVPWDGGVVIKVMVLWIMAFWILGHWVIDFGLEVIGKNREDLTVRGQALIHLLLDVSEMGVTIGILWRCLRQYRPIALGWFAVKLRPLRNWLPQVLAAAVTFPLVEWAAACCQIWFPCDGDLWGANMIEQALAAGDPVTNALYFVVVTMCAPIWEEAIFRGFLLPSLTRYFPIRGAVVASAVIFSLAHFSFQGFLPLFLLGLIFGTLFARTRNLLSSIALHSAWNLYIFLKLAVQGSLV